MTTSDYEIKISPESHKLARWWVIFAVTIFTIASLYSTYLLLNSSNLIENTPLTQSIFTTNINLSTSIWFLSCIGGLWTISTIHNIGKFDWLALFLTIIGAAVIAAMPFISDDITILNKHIPIIKSDYFFISLAIFASGIISAAFATLARFKTNQSSPILTKDISSILKMGIGYTSVIILIAMGCFFLAYEEIKLLEKDHALNDAEYYNLFFWGGGHVLQYAYIQAMVIIWIIIAAASGINLKINRGLLFFVFVTYTLSTIPAGYIYGTNEITSYAHKNFFTTHIRYIGGVAVIIIGFFILKDFLCSKSKGTKKTRHLRYALIFSLFLTTIGIIINFTSYNLETTPPHNQSLIGGITLAMMGFIFYIMPKIGFAPIKSLLASFTIITYASGEILKTISFIWAEILKASPLTDLTIIGNSLTIFAALIFLTTTYRSIFPKNRYSKY